jgi:hypothetical protein
VAAVPIASQFRIKKKDSDVASSLTSLTHIGNKCTSGTRKRSKKQKEKKNVQRILNFYKLNQVELLAYFHCFILLLVCSYTGVGVNSKLNLADFSERHPSLVFMSVATNLDIQQKSKTEKCTY